MIATALPDADLLAQARDGDEAAFTELYVRHQAAARRLASSYGQAGDPDDLVNESFERVLVAIRRGGGPDEAFRAYLFVTLRRLAADRIERSQDEAVEQVPEPIRAEEQVDPLDTGEREMVLAAYESLPERWQAVLWQTAVEGRQPRELAPTFGMSANAAAALAYRAREKLRQAYLQAHLQADPRPGCEPHRSRLGAYVRDGLGRRDRTAADTHLTGCAGCTALVTELRDIDRMLVRAVQPYFLGTGVNGTARAAAGGGAAGLVAQRAWARARSNPMMAVGLAAVAAAVTLGVVAARGSERLTPGGDADVPAEQAGPREGRGDAPPGGGGAGDARTSGGSRGGGASAHGPASPSATQAVASRHTTTTSAAAGIAAAGTGVAPSSPAPPAPSEATGDAPSAPPTAPPGTTPPSTSPPPTSPPPTSPPPPPPAPTPPTTTPPLLLDTQIEVDLLGIPLSLDLRL